MKLNFELQNAAASGQTERVLELLKQGADIHARYIYCHQKAGAEAAGECHGEGLPALPGGELEAVVMDRIPRGTDAPLRLAAANGHTATVKLLLDQGAIACAADNIGRDAPLRLAAANGHTETAKLLLDRGAAFRRPLCFAADHGHIAAVKFLVNLRADSYDPDTVGMEIKYLDWALCYAAEKGHTEIVDFLLNHKTDIEARQPHEAGTPLLYAATNGHTETVRLLLDRGAKINVWDDRIELKKLASVKRAGEIDRQIAAGTDLPDITMDNLMGWLESLGGQAKRFLEEAIVEVFEFLRPPSLRYKTNSGFRVGKRVILTNRVEREWRGVRFRVNYHHENELRALDNVFHLLDGQPLSNYRNGDLINSILESANGAGDTEYFRFKSFLNGNLHLEFLRMDLVQRLNQVGGNGLPMPDRH